MSLKAIVLTRLAPRGLPAWCLIFALLASVGAATAAPPFDVRGPDFANTAAVVDSVSNSCADHNNNVSMTGVSVPGGLSQPGTCGFSTFEIIMDGQPVTLYWQLVSSGANPPPFRTIFKPPPPPPRLGFCAVATAMRVELGAVVQPTVLSWPRAAVIGGACAAESGRHPVIDFSGIYTRAFTTLRLIGQVLNRALSRNQVEVCLSEIRTPHTEAVATLQLAKAVAKEVQLALASHPVVSLQTQFTQGAGIGNSCLLRCNQCGSGWAGTITNNQKVTDNAGQFLAKELDTYFVGGTATVVGNTTTYPADWTASGSGYNLNGAKQWILNAAASGGCPGSDQHVCVEVITDMTGARSFTEVNPPLSINNGYLVTQNGVTFPSAAGENQFKNFISISASATDKMAVGHQQVQPAAAINCTLPPLHSGVLTCTQTWDWQLFLQP